jgi:endonuclease YncB( thermonuclease family)
MYCLSFIPYSGTSRGILSFITIVFLSAVIIVLPNQSFANQYKATRVVDGDTLKATSESGQKITVRLVGIDAPELGRGKRKPGQPFSRKATKYLNKLALNKSVSVESYGLDRYGRTLGVVFVDGKDVNLEMIKAGLAEVYRGRPAKGQDLEPYWKAEKEAKAELRGMWVLKDQYVSPREWRKK